MSSSEDSPPPSPTHPHAGVLPGEAPPRSTFDEASPPLSRYRDPHYAEPDDFHRLPRGHSRFLGGYGDPYDRRPYGMPLEPGYPMRPPMPGMGPPGMGVPFPIVRPGPSLEEIELQRVLELSLAEHVQEEEARLKKAEDEKAALQKQEEIKQNFLKFSQEKLKSSKEDNPDEEDDEWMLKQHEEQAADGEEADIEDEEDAEDEEEEEEEQEEDEPKNVKKP